MIEVVQGISPAVVSDRQREVWTYADKRAMDRAGECCFLHGVRLALTCKNPVCPSPDVQLAPSEVHPGRQVLRCGCTDRELSTDKTC